MPHLPHLFRGPCMENAPIFFAISNRQPEAVKLLAYLSKNHPNPLATKDGFSPIQIAEEFGAEEIVAILKNVANARVYRMLNLTFVFEIF